MSLGLSSAVVEASERPFAPALWYTLGSVVGGATTAVAASIALMLVGPSHVWSIAAGVVAAVYGLAWVARVQAPVPSGVWQVPRKWYERVGDSAFLAYGGVLAAGWVTPIYFPTFYVLLLLYGAIGVSVALAVGAYYGLLRALMTVLSFSGPEVIPGRVARGRTFRSIGNAALLLVAVTVGLQNA